MNKTINTNISISKIFKTLLYPFLILSHIGLGYFLFINKIHPLVCMALPAFIGNFVLFFLEKLIPKHAEWKLEIKEILPDLFHTFINSLMVIPLTKNIISALIIILSGQLSLTDLWPKNFPFILQVILAIYIADLGLYFLHRFFHQNNFGWRIHVAHHTPKKMNFIVSVRSHPINVFLTYIFEVGLLSLLGVPLPVLICWNIFMSVNGMIQHSNIDFNYGIFNQIFGTGDVHQIHHSTNYKLSNSNFGNTTVLWDKIFNTFSNPTTTKMNHEVGIKFHHIPENYWDHLKSAFYLDRYKSKEYSKLTQEAKLSKQESAYFDPTIS